MINMEKLEINISDTYITLGQILKLANLFESGGMIKSYIQDEGVLVNGERDFRRGRKLYDGDVVCVEDNELIVKSNVN